MSDLGNVRKDNTKFAAGWKGSDDYYQKRKLAEKGDANAQCSLGLLCVKNASYDDAGTWFLRAAKKGNAEAYYELGHLYENNKLKDVSGCDEKVIKYFGISAILGFHKGQQKLADCYFEGKHGVQKDQSLAREWYGYAAKQNNAKAALKLAVLSHNTEEAYEWYKLAATNGSAEAQYECALRCEDKKEKEKWLLASAGHEYVPASMMLADIYKADGSAESNRKAYNIYDQVYKKHNNADAAVKMAEMLTDKMSGIKQDIILAKELIENAAKRKHPEALFKLDNMK